MVDVAKVVMVGFPTNTFHEFGTDQSMILMSPVAEAE